MVEDPTPAPEVPRAVEIETAARAFLVAFDNWRSSATIRHPQPPWPAGEIDALRRALASAPAAEKG